MITLVVAALKLIYVVTSRILSPDILLVVKGLSITLIMAFTLVTTITSILFYDNKLHLARSDQFRFFVPELGGFLEARWKD
jgi:hypothetical protein